MDSEEAFEMLDPTSSISSSSSSSSSEVGTAIDSEGVLMPLIHKHLMMPLKDTYSMRYPYCCGRFQINNDGYDCRSCYFVVHKSCAESSVSIQHPSHPGHTLQLLRKDLQMKRGERWCDLCGKNIVDLCYHCEICDFDMDLYCTKYPPPEVIDISDMHHHKLTLLKKWIKFECAACGDTHSKDVGFPYKCDECDLAFHVDCVWHPSELVLNHSHHPLHPLKPHREQFPAYSDSKCRLCGGGTVDKFFYHCALCNFTVDVKCITNPPPISLLNKKAHDHELTLLPRLDSFTCNACGLKGDRSPYVCLPCGFMIHRKCLDLPRVININRHDHRVSRSSVLGVVNSVCGVCRKKMDWTRGGYSCQKCRGYVVHSKCATRKDVWNGEELEGIPEKIEDIEPYVVIDENTILHFSHKEHPLRLHVNDDQCDEKKRCRACTHPICLQSFYGCIQCDFILHQNCAGLLKKKRHFIHNDLLTLVTDDADIFECNACEKRCNGFRYVDKGKIFDVRCASIPEPFSHTSHPDHPLYYSPSRGGIDFCSGCNHLFLNATMKCIEDDCGFVLCFLCATLPLVVKHRVDDHPLSLCYGEKGSDTYWCDICEKKTDPEGWFYTCKDQRASLHTNCVVGRSFSNIMPGRTIKPYEGSYEVVLNNSVSRPICRWCKLHCIYPIILKELKTSDYICSNICWLKFDGMPPDC